jgi:hypothetical protein
VRIPIMAAPIISSKIQHSGKQCACYYHGRARAPHTELSSRTFRLLELLTWSEKKEGRYSRNNPGKISENSYEDSVCMCLIACGIREVKREKGMDVAAAARERERRGKRRHVRNRRQGPRVARLCFSAALSDTACDRQFAEEDDEFV